MKVSLLVMGFGLGLGLVTPSDVSAAESLSVALEAEEMGAALGASEAVCLVSASSAGPCRVRGWHFAAALAGCAIGMFPIFKAYKVLKAAARSLRAGEKWGSAVGTFFCADAWLAGWSWAECLEDNGLQDNGIWLDDLWSGIYADDVDDGAVLDLADALDTEAELIRMGFGPGDPW